ncbi:unnamed protein product [Medioppia subpectinata]|uniref:Uncharacterized protein n=1 Tax=Medioppia subpectinata TaxID=1979941 RepID=A0A7R9KJ53_9ACAR|nr:unnamed protein product [Medioppia subpectinata]CAG2104633.1 unnamed protein product [Medioppia subpectinata]
MDVLLTALYNSPSDKRMSQTLQCRTSSSFRRKINSAFSTLNSRSAQSAATDAFLSYCDYNYNISGNRLNSHNNKLKSQSPKENHCLDKESINTVINDYSLGDVVDEFEEAWNESHSRRQSNASDCDQVMHKQHIMTDSERGPSPPTSPTPSSCTSSNISRVVLSQIRDQMAMSLTRVKELENQMKFIPNLKQKVIVLREENKRLMRRLEGDSDDGNILNDPQNKTRVRELERSGFITPPLMRRKNHFKSESDTEDDEFGDIWMRSSPPPEKLISSKNIRLEELNDRLNDSPDSGLRKSIEMISVSTSTESVSKAFTVEMSTNTEQMHAKDNKLSFDILSSISIQPEKTPTESISTATPPIAKRSIGISTSLAPSLPRKSVAVETDLKAIDTISVQELEVKKPAMVSWGTDPIRVVYTHSQTQASPKCCDVSTKTEVHALKNTGVGCNAKDFGLKVNWTQTDGKTLHHKTIQCSQSCAKCELKQTETIGIGDNNVYGSVLTDKAMTTERERPASLDGLLSASPVSRASSAQSIRLCDKCNDAITSVATDFVTAPHEKLASPTIQSRIPRPIQSTGSLERRTIDDKIIEETANEILVYKNPSLSVGSSPLKRNSPLKIPDLSPKTRSFKKTELSPQTSQAIKLIDDVFKISESDESEDESSSSSDEGTYEVETGAVAKPIVRTRVEPSKEIKAALKVLNDNLIKPEKANKSALDKSLSIIEKEWFKVAADQTSDSHCVEDYIDCFETFSKHLLNRVVNLDDKSGNTAIHYAISHNNFDIVSVLLDSKAGYTATMLVSLSKVDNETQKAVIRRLFQLGDVNIKAKQNGQTALMLAGSHGQFFTCKILLECGAAINLQDNDGSTALMCAAEHGHTDVVRLLLSHPDCDPTIVDNDDSTALKIAMANNNNDIGLMLYASTSMLSRGSSPYASLRRTQSKAIAASLRRTGSFSYGYTRSSPQSLQLAPSPPPRSRHSSTSTTRSAKTKSALNSNNNN